MNVTRADHVLPALARGTSSTSQKQRQEAVPAFHDACAMALDLAQPISVTDLISLSVAKAGLEGDTGAIELVIAKVEEAINRKARPQ